MYHNIHWFSFIQVMCLGFFWGEEVRVVCLFLPCHAACGISIPQSGMENGSLSVKVWSHNQGIPSDLLYFTSIVYKLRGFPGGSAGKESTCNVGDLGSIPGLGRSPGEKNSNPLQYSGLENSTDYTWVTNYMDSSWVTKSRTWLSGFHSHYY